MTLIVVDARVGDISRYECLPAFFRLTHAMSSQVHTEFTLGNIVEMREHPPHHGVVKSSEPVPIRRISRSWPFIGEGPTDAA